MAKIVNVLLLVGLVCIGADLLHACALSGHQTEIKSNDGSNNHSASTVGTIHERVLAVFQSQVGVKENLGTNDSKEIREYLRSVGIKSPAYYCAAFVCWGFTVCDIPNPKTGWSPSLFPVEHIVNLQTTVPDTCDVFGIYHNNLKRIAHVGIIKHWPRDRDYFISIEGNTNNNGSRNGDGVYEKRRPKRSIARVSRWIGRLKV